MLHTNTQIRSATKTHYQVVLLSRFIIHSYLASPITILHFHSNWQLGRLSVEIDFHLFTNKHTNSHTHTSVVCQAWRPSSVSLQKQAVSLCCGGRRSMYTDVLLHLHHLAVCSPLQQLPSPQGPPESVNLIPPNGFHQLKWKGNDTSGTLGP